MTKREIVKWLEEQERLKQLEAHNRYTEAMVKERERFTASINIEEITDQIHSLIDKAIDLHTDWIGELSARDDLTTNIVRYDSFQTNIYRLCTREKIAAAIRAEVINISPEHKRIEGDFQSERANITSNYRNVICHVRTLSTAQKALHYLRELGFDVSELERDKANETTAVAVPVDVNYLFLKTNKVGEPNA